MGSNGLSDAWQRNADDWTSWARDSAADPFDEAIGPAIVDSVSDLPAYSCVLDLGCGEGRSSRILTNIGLDVYSIDSSKKLITYAQSADVGREDRYTVANATHLPFEEGVFDAVVAVNVLQDVDDLQGVILESRRVLARTGRFVAMIGHPFRSAGAYNTQTDRSTFQVENNYLETRRQSVHAERNGLRFTFETWHRSLSAYVQVICGSGFSVVGLNEHYLPAVTMNHKSIDRQLIPTFLSVVATPLAGSDDLVGGSKGMEAS